MTDDYPALTLNFAESVGDDWSRETYGYLSEIEFESDLIRALDEAEVNDMIPLIGQKECDELKDYMHSAYIKSPKSRKGFLLRAWRYFAASRFHGFRKREASGRGFRLCTMNDSWSFRKHAITELIWAGFSLADISRRIGIGIGSANRVDYLIRLDDYVRTYCKSQSRDEILE